MKTTNIFILTLFITFISNAQSIYKSSIDSGGASVSVGGLQVLYTIGEVHVQEFISPNLSVSEGFINTAFKIKIDPIVFLQGPMLNPATAGQMNDNLRTGSLIPTTSPYADAATCDASVFSVTGANAIVDWVWVELRDANDNTNIVNARSALLQRDGDVVNLDGLSNLIMSAAPTSYFVVVKHRNHLGVMSAATIALKEATTTVVDFTNSGFLTFGTNGQAQLASNDMALWAGNANGNNNARYLGPSNDSSAIKNAVISDSGNGTNSNYYPFTGYNNADLNMNGQVRYLGPSNDSAILKNIIINHPDNTTGSNYFPIQISF